MLKLLIAWQADYPSCQDLLLTLSTTFWFKKHFFVILFEHTVCAFSVLTTKRCIVFSSMRSILRNHRFRRDARTLEDEEEMWFNTDEDDLEDGEAVVPPSDKMKAEEDLMEPISKFMERKKCMYEMQWFYSWQICLSSWWLMANSL